LSSYQLQDRCQLQLDGAFTNHKSVKRRLRQTPPEKRNDIRKYRELFPIALAADLQPDGNLPGHRRFLRLCKPFGKCARAMRHDA
jgi:hypothetical protein